MEAIFKTWKQNTYFEGIFKIRDKNKNWASPIDFPTVFVAYGKAIKSGNWQSCTAINTPEYVIKHYFDTIGNNKHDAMYNLWQYCMELSKIDWNELYKNENKVIELVNLANTELRKLKTI